MYVYMDIETAVPANTEAALRTMSLLLTCSSSTTALAALTTTHPVKHIFTMYISNAHAHAHAHAHACKMHGAVSCEGYGPLCTPLSSSPREAKVTVCTLRSVTYVQIEIVLTEM